jgi:hypothetical protein
LVLVKGIIELGFQANRAEYKDQSSS